MRLCAAVLAAGLVGGGRAMDDNTIKAAVELWESDRAAAEAQYGPISAWDTADVVDMEKLFHFSTDFNEDIGAWNTSSVTSMNRMFWYAIDFDQPIGAFAASESSAPPGAEPAQAPGTSARSRTLSACSATRRCSTKTSARFAASTSTPSPRSRTRAGDWRVDNAETMDRMFVGASAFEQDLDWCTLATVDSAFLNSPCELKKDCVLQCPSFPFFCLFSDLFDLFLSR